MHQRKRKKLNPKLMGIVSFLAVVTYVFILPYKTLVVKGLTDDNDEEKDDGDSPEYTMGIQFQQPCQ